MPEIGSSDPEEDLGSSAPEQDEQSGVYTSLIVQHPDLDPKVLERALAAGVDIAFLNQVALMVTKADGSRHLICRSLAEVHDITGNDTELEELADAAGVAAENFGSMGKDHSA